MATTHDTITDHEAELVSRHIELHPHRPGTAHARLKERGIPVWAIIGHLAMVEGDSAQTATDYVVPQEAVEAAIAYYHQHRDVIDARLAANRAA